MKIIKRTSSKFAYRLSFLKVLNSPFRGLKLRWYFGNIKHGMFFEFHPELSGNWEQDKNTIASTNEN